uniref:Uncharacterized protein n=1 Tax=Anguilla anguilla TaxID=7936 RepID=A0A0E9QCJ8_ANGAN
MEKSRYILDWSCQSPDLNPNEHVFHFLMRRPKTENPQNKDQLKAVAGRA